MQRFPAALFWLWCGAVRKSVAVNNDECVADTLETDGADTETAEQHRYTRVHRDWHRVSTVNQFKLNQTGGRRKGLYFGFTLCILHGDCSRCLLSALDNWVFILIVLSPTLVYCAFSATFNINITVAPICLLRALTWPTWQQAAGSKVGFSRRNLSSTTTLHSYP